MFAGYLNGERLSRKSDSGVLSTARQGRRWKVGLFRIYNVL